MINLFEAYSKFFNSGSIEEMKSNLISCDSDSGWLYSAQSMHEEYVNAVKLYATYLDEFGIDARFSRGINAGKNIRDILISSEPYVRLTVGVQDIDSLVDAMMNPVNVPIQEFNADKTFFDGKLHFEIDEPVDMSSFLRDVASQFVFGIMLSDMLIISQLKSRYILSGQIMQAAMYSLIGTDICRKLCVDAIRSGISIGDWCTSFDGIWFDVSGQLSDGFVTIFNPQNPKKVSCISTLYSGKYFTTNMVVFKELYEGGFLGSIRFVDKVVPVQTYVSGKPANVVNKQLNVPVFYDNDNEVLVSDFTSPDYIYNEVFYTDVGRI